ncbi:hypothetical protein BDQ17DRAFT_1320396 [Cyathus striatus]|nr:hypothetical protein BDQ17DRAFT_1320396 [Cyathus striatus]
MFSLNSAKFSLTLLFALSLLLAISSPVYANDHTLHHREHSSLKRLVKKRSPLPASGSGGLFSGGLLGGEGAVAGAAGDPDTSVDSSSSTSSVAAAASSTSSSAVTSQSTSSAATSASTTSSASESVSASVSSATSSSASSDSTSASGSTSSSASSTVSSSSTSASSTSDPNTSTTTSAQAAVETQQAENTDVATSQAAASHTSKAVVTKTTTIDASESPAVEAQSASAKTKGTALTALIAVAASIGGVAILWTIFRKWKLGRSSKFDERLQPIDWQPKPEDDALPGVHRSTSHASSFHSAGHSNYNFSDHSHGGNNLQPIPDHDFTAGTSLAPVGGYADLARGPSPQPQMHEPLTRGPSFNRGYDAGVPLHHQTGYGTNDVYDYNGGAARY